MAINLDIRIDKTVLTVTGLFGTSSDDEYWLSKTPYERLQAVELTRQIIYGYDPSTTRLQRVLTITQHSSG
jgi:hypothetical protein